MRHFLFVFALVAGCGNSTPAEVQLLPIGSPCQTSAECGTGKFYCDVDHPGGYCKRDCKVDTDCPTGSVCAGAGMIAPGGCHKKCTSAADCRTAAGYICKMMPSDASGPYCDVPEPAAGDGGP